MKLSLVKILAVCMLVLSGCSLRPLPAYSAPEGTGLPLPRFVSLRAKEVNLRAGPGVQYPIDWVFKRQRLPLEIIAEFKAWRKVRDWEGDQGWVHQSMVAGKRTVIITGKTRTLRSKADSKSSAVVRVENYVIGKLLACPGTGRWCSVEVDGFKGWLRRVEFWGVHLSESLE
jgi:SH3-like domain-containing protein